MEPLFKEEISILPGYFLAKDIANDADELAGQGEGVTNHFVSRHPLLRRGLCDALGCSHLDRILVEPSFFQSG